MEVTPIYKGCGSREDMNNYRPISVLPLLSKILEKHVHHSLYSYLTEKKFFYHLQSGFRRWHSTETALIRVVDQLLMDLDQNNVNGLIFIDYKKAFDFIQHNILIAKLKSLGINSREIAFFTNYLKNRTHVVEIEGYRSTPKTITNGVPQGSVLGPLLFIVFINDLPKAVKKSVVDIYADDTTISASAVLEFAHTAIQDQLQEDMNQVVRWSCDNKMILNASKTKTMLVTGKRLASKLTNVKLNIQVNGHKVEDLCLQKLLGLHIDKELNFTEHVDVMCKKMGQRIGILNKIKRHLLLNERKLYYNAMIKPIMMYRYTVWSSCSSENLERVYKLQKRAARVILDVDTGERSANLFKALNWFPLHDEIKIQRCCVIYNRVYGQSTQYMEQMLTRNADYDSRSNRHSKVSLVCPRYKRESEGGGSFGVIGSKLWNTIPADVRSNDSFHSFKKTLKKYFLEQYN